MLNLQEEGLPLLNGQKLPRFLWNSLLQQAACFARGFYAAWSVLQKKRGVVSGAVWGPGRFIPIPCYPPQARCGCRRKDAESCCCSAGHCRLTVSQPPSLALPQSPDPFPISSIHPKPGKCQNVPDCLPPSQAPTAASFPESVARSLVAWKCCVTPETTRSAALKGGDDAGALLLSHPLAGTAMAELPR